MEKLEIRIGGNHFFFIGNSLEIYSGKIIENIGKLYVCKMEEYGLYYLINALGEVMVYSEMPSSYSSEVIEGICFVSIPLIPISIYVFEEKPLEVDEFLLLSDGHSPYFFQVNQKTMKVSK